MAFKVAVVGATGNVGREMLSVLAEREFPVSEVYALASARSAGSEVSFGDDDVLKVQESRRLSTSRASTSRCFRPAPRCRPSTRRAPPRPARW